MTVLHSYEVYSNSGFMDVVLVVSLCFALLFVVLCVASIAEGDWVWAIGFLVFAVTLFLGTGKVFFTVLETHTEYEVIIHDYNEVYEQGYKIVEERGDITVIKRIEEADE